MAEFDRHARYYDFEHADYQEDLAMYAGFAATAGETGVLELACGTGRCLLPLAGSGTAVVGLDISPAMLSIAREKVERAKPRGRVDLFEADMRGFSLGRTFGLIFIALNSLMHVETQEDQARTLACAAQHLAAGGRLVVDLFNPDVVLPDPLQEGQLFLHCLKPRGATHVLHFQSPTVDRAAQVVSVTNFYDEIDAGGAVKRYLAPFKQRYLTRGEIGLLLTQAGLDVEVIYGSYELDPFDASSERLIAVARR
jgi:SAM-dependent methyltransferase